VGPVGPGGGFGGRGLSGSMTFKSRRRMRCSTIRTHPQ
jgi:hypothetical protein